MREALDYDSGETIALQLQLRTIGPQGPPGASAAHFPKECAQVRVRRMTLRSPPPNPTKCNHRTCRQGVAAPLQRGVHAQERRPPGRPRP